ncbi:MAG TPA: 3-phosphoshikimate 1-carboxyvinyltransferase [Bacteroidales bacterium]|nr:3-phosphoshikimate 1-carboxyvinyltransferase [Bacteroidales bacterium]HPS74730.1 3-phosphoshikimate 1-carboxyvinyltransferase [Bacteroidales bacterium]
MNSIIVSAPTTVLKGRVTLPASKSISNRVMIIRALSGADFPVSHLSDADDTVLLSELLEKIASHTTNEVCELDTANAGTVMRFLTPYLALRPGTWMLTGSDRMRQRPIGVLVDALNSLGAEISYLAKPDYPPLLIKGRSFVGGEITVDAGISSQFISALLMIAPLLPEGLIIRYKNRPVSSPYITMTTRLMRTFGVKTEPGKNFIKVPQGQYQPVAFEVESDWSSAAFWYEAAALATEAELELPGLASDSMQGDSVLPGIFANFGVSTEYTGDSVILRHTGRKVDGFYFDFTDYPDLAPAVITTCVAVGIRGRFEGLASLRIKETDRIAALKTEYEKLGGEVDSTEVTDMIQSLEVAPSKTKKIHYPPAPFFETYGDHRMAMTFAPLSLLLGPVKIVNPEVVTKSYPGFWEEMKKAGFTIE